ncbi:MAG: hypothetical protein HOV81_39130 [Kofleriaceae bacterium]|nr:hypothetical protein [Kofleriaceae bacterium]
MWRRAVGAICCLAGCGDNLSATPGLDAAPAEDAADAPFDPFAGVFDDPSDFPNTDCTPGALNGFSFAEQWPLMGLRTVFEPGLETYITQANGTERKVPHILTADYLYFRSQQFQGTRWYLNAVNICNVDADGTLRGYQAFCRENVPDCQAFPFADRPLRRLPGETEGEHLTLIGETGATWSGMTTNVRVAGDVAYLSRLDDGLRIVSFANPTAPVEVGHLRVPGDNANDLKIVEGDDGRRYVVTASSPCNVIDVTDPTQPSLVAQLPFPAHTLFVEGQTAYLVSAADAKVDIWDLSLPRAPVRLTTWDGPAFAGWHDLYVAGGIAYLSDSFGTGLHVVDFRVPTAPIWLGGEDDMDFVYWHSSSVTTVGGRTIAVHGDEGPASGVRILDVDPTAPTFLNTLGSWHVHPDRPETSIHNVMAIGNRAYLAHYRDGVRVLDLSTPSAPVQVGYYNTWIPGSGEASLYDGAFGIDLDPDRRRIYVADSDRGFMILEGDTTIFPPP